MFRNDAMRRGEASAKLELLREVLSGTKTTFVFGSGDLANQVRGLVGRTDPDPA